MTKSRNLWREQLLPLHHVDLGPDRQRGAGGRGAHPFLDSLRRSDPVGDLHDVVRAFGFTSRDFVVRISDREFWTELLKLEKVPPERWEETLQTIDKSEREPREKTQERLGKLAGPVFEIFEKGGESAKLNKIIENLRMRGLGDFATIDVRIVRGLAYYTGVVFEVFDRVARRTDEVAAGEPRLRGASGAS